MLVFNKNLKINKILISTISIFVLLIVVLTTFTLIKSNSDEILSGVTCAGYDLSGMTVDEASSVLSDAVSSSSKKTLTIKTDDDSFTATYSDLGVSFNCAETANNAYSYGHSGFFKSIIPSLRSIFGFETKIELVSTINNRMFNKIMSENTDYDISVESTFVLEDNAIKVTNGKSAYTVNPVKARDELSFMMKNLDFSTLTLTKAYIDPIPLDIQTIIEDYSNEPKDASYQRNENGEIYVTPGNDQVIVDKKEALEIINSHTAEGETYSIPAKVNFASYTSSELEEALFRDTLSSYTTSYSTSDANRSHNVALAAKSLDGKILLPGESLSYNDTLGKRTAEAGYKMAGAYANGQTVQEYGGGICQVSSTLYNAVLLANLKVDSRTCHMFKVAYVPLGRDATVDYGTVDFVFSNDTPYPIKLSCITTPSKQVICNISGTKTENFTVTLEMTDYSTVPFSTKTEEDSEMPEGTEKYTEKGSDGARCKIYRVVSVDGKEVSRTLESSSYYMPHNAVLVVGTKKAEDALGETIVSPDEPVIENPDISNPENSDKPLIPSVEENTTPSDSTPSVSTESETSSAPGEYHENSASEI